MRNRLPEDPTATTRRWQRYGTYEDFPSSSNSSPTYAAPIRASMPPARILPKRNSEHRDYDGYLRSRWSCTEAIPHEFDPARLELVFQSQYKPPTKHRAAQTSAKGGNNSLQPTTLNGRHSYSPYSSLGSNSTDFTVASSLDTDEVPREVTTGVATAQTITQMRSPTEPIDPMLYLVSSPEPVEPVDPFLYLVPSSPPVEPVDPMLYLVSTPSPPPVEPVNPMLYLVSTPSPPPIERISDRRVPTPRIRTGSKPLLSRSAFANTTLPHPDGNAQRRHGGGGPRSPKGHSSTSMYFPYESRKGRYMN
ncbi:uncharacterized protein F4822DRAFT_432462 [Hypoxylon trugodes]|uniref:uncharacterized protein n=1 Tax=Hypoxylon trugodes TaxID=326681 RepID=UPI00218E4092|nr:uncharacterized protein F4822DRAFT_432462 [Hypoxylon trugodes]KAI1385606.1 hypothetical protein F4822DRAFT_432462 [Hypoxylon trugodes]